MCYRMPVSAAPEKLVALVEPVQGVDGAVVGGKLQLGEAGRLLAVRSGGVGSLGTTHRGGGRVVRHNGTLGVRVGVPGDTPEGGGRR
jgi:hypothetical protein